MAYLGTTSAGLEFALRDELAARLAGRVSDVSTVHGGVRFTTEAAPEDLQQLRAVDNLYAFVASREDVPHGKEAIDYFTALPAQIDWQPALSLFHQWQQCREDGMTSAAGENRQELTSLVEVPEKSPERKRLRQEGESAEVVTPGATDTADVTPPEGAPGGTPEGAPEGTHAGGKAAAATAAVAEAAATGKAAERQGSGGLQFRVTCHRICMKLTKHGFSSPEAAGALGEGLQGMFPSWTVSLRQFDLEVLAWIRDSHLTLLIALIYADSPKSSEEGSKEQQKGQPKEQQTEQLKENQTEQTSKDVDTGGGGGEGKKKAGEKAARAVQARSHNSERQLYSSRTYRKALVQTSLKPSMAFALLQLADIHPGHIVLDPMCGCGTLPLEAADWLQSRVSAFGGDKDTGAVDAAATNSIALRTATANSSTLGMAIANGDAARRSQGGHVTGCDWLVWDASALPLRTGCVDRVLCDMPFGVRCGNFKMRERLCPAVIRQVARVLTPGTGVAVLMAVGRGVRAAVEGLAVCLREKQRLPVEMEGIRVDVYLLERTRAPIPEPPPPAARLARNKQ
ncbi:unnamed protein product [Closterium sp. Naga37s-1]|nr:unnamed protein product [Closterium sp. Naga37s-1]